MHGTRRDGTQARGGMMVAGEAEELGAPAVCRRRRGAQRKKHASLAAAAAAGSALFCVHVRVAFDFSGRSAVASWPRLAGANGTTGADDGGATSTGPHRETAGSRTSTSTESCCGPGLTGEKCSEGHLAAEFNKNKKDARAARRTPVKNSRPQSKSVDPGQNQSTQGVPRSKSTHQPNTFEIPSPFPSRWKLRWKIVRP